MVQRDAAFVMPEIADRIRCPFLILHGLADNVIRAWFTQHGILH
jgi:hypothetical protein